MQSFIMLKWVCKAKYTMTDRKEGQVCAQSPYFMFIYLLLLTYFLSFFSSLQLVVYIFVCSFVCLLVCEDEYSG